MPLIEAEHTFDWLRERVKMIQFLGLFGIPVCALLAGLLTLNNHRDVFVPYVPAPLTRLSIFAPKPHESPLINFPEAGIAALHLRDLADEKITAGLYPEAAKLLIQADQVFSHVDGLFDRLSAVYFWMGHWSLSLSALEAAELRTSVFSMWGYKTIGISGIPESSDRTYAAGLGDCIHRPSPFLDLLAPGVVVADFDNDGSNDLICLGGNIATRMYRGTPQGFAFLHDTGLEIEHAAQGAFAVDLTHDGLLDVIVTGMQETKLFINQGSLRFKTAPLNLPTMWGSAVAAADFTGDGNIDLVLGGWINIDFKAVSKEMAKYRESLASPNPDAPLDLLNLRPRFGVQVRLLEGNGAGAFVDITSKSGVNVSGSLLNLELIDVNADGHLDLLIINDSTPSHLFLGDGRGHFRDETYAARFADVRAGMGLAIGDFNGDGEWDFITTHFQGEMNGAFMSNGFQGDIPLYRDAALENGLGAPSLPFVGWAAFAWDFDADSREDLLVVNGHVRSTPQALHLFRNLGDGFEDVSAVLPPPLNTPLRGRGAALFDDNGDGYDDLLVAQNDGPLRLFEMTPRHGNNWLRVRLRLTDVDALGGVLELVDSWGRKQKRPVRTGSAYFSTQPRDYFFGLGKAEPRELIWRGRTSSLICQNLLADQIVTLTEKGCR